MQCGIRQALSDNCQYSDTHQIHIDRSNINQKYFSRQQGDGSQTLAKLPYALCGKACDQMVSRFGVESVRMINSREFSFEKILKVSCSSSICHFSFSLRHCRKRSFLTRITLLHRQLNVIGARCHRILQNTAPIQISKLWQSFVSLF